jgi:drug/metabolite transporter (DMT)-like permease
MNTPAPRLPPLKHMAWGTALLLTIPPLMWACNAVVGRLAGPLVPPMMLNFLRWTVAFVLLLPLAAGVLSRHSPLWPHWRRYALLGLLSVGCYNALQYLALHTSTPINVTLVAASTPVWMLLIGRLFFGAAIGARQVLGAVLSIAGVLLVLSRAELPRLLAIELVAGDVYILLASIAWAWYSWLLTQSRDPPALRSSWSAFLMAQIVFGLGWSALFAAGEWVVSDAPIDWGWPLVGILFFVAVGPSLLAYRCWTAGIARAGPTVAGFFSNLTPLLAALLSTLWLGEVPQLYHAAAFALIVGGIVVTSRR